MATEAISSNANVAANNKAVIENETLLRGIKENLNLNSTASERIDYLLSLPELSVNQQMALQTALDDFSRMVAFLSNVLKNMQEGLMAIIRNIGR
jgi:hypothetical protein